MNDIDYLKDEIHCLYADKKELQERINKAIEILKLCNTNCSKEVINILKGSNSNGMG